MWVPPVDVIWLQVSARPHASTAPLVIKTCTAPTKPTPSTVVATPTTAVGPSSKPDLLGDLGRDPFGKYKLVVVGKIVYSFLSPFSPPFFPPSSPLSSLLPPSLLPPPPLFSPPLPPSCQEEACWSSSCNGGNGRCWCTIAACQWHSQTRYSNSWL